MELIFHAGENIFI